MPTKPTEIRALRKVPAESRVLHGAAEAILVIIEPRVQATDSKRHDCTRGVMWNLVLDLRDLCDQLERRYPVLRDTTRRPNSGDPERN